MDKKASWGGKRPGAGRKRQLEIEHRKQIANDYFERIQDRRESDLQSKPPRRKPIIKELVDEYRVTPRMITRAIAEFLTELRIFAYATKGMKRGRSIRRSAELECLLSLFREADAGL